MMIDHQSGTMLGVQGIRLDQFRSNVLALPSIGRVHNLPTILTASFAEGPNGPLMRGLVEMHPEASNISRPGWTNAWEDPAFKAAIHRKNAPDLPKWRIRNRGVTILTQNDAL